jgi:hypothetical protein
MVTDKLAATFSRMTDCMTELQAALDTLQQGSGDREAAFCAAQDRYCAYLDAVDAFGAVFNDVNRIVPARHGSKAGVT